uniref:Variant surface glycoprotein 483 n=1 Tax=Trypanosoma brucei TaxID=5691 RepID=M4T057_9TRYP|nr:variant surface glycoprotein 483 [Trypanosoma brucei]
MASITRPTVLILHLIFATWSAAAAADKTFGEAGAAVNGICSEATFLITLATKLVQTVEARQDLSVSLRKDVERFHLAAASPQLRDRSRHFTALALYAQQQLYKVNSQEQAIRHAAELFVRQADRWAGNLIGAKSIASATITKDNSAATTLNSNDASIPLAKAANPSGQCANTKVSATFADGKALDLDKVKKLKLSDADKLRDAVGKLTLTLTGCTDNTGTCTPGSQAFDGTQNQNSIVKLHASADNKAFKIKSLSTSSEAYTGGAGTDIGQAADTPEKCRNSGTFENTLIPTRETIAHNLCHLNHKLREPRQGKEIKNGNDLAADDDFLILANNLLVTEWQRADLRKSETKTSLANLIKNVFGDTDTKFDERFRNAADKQTIIYGTGATPEKGTIGELAGTPAAETALSYLIGQREKEILTKANDAKPTVPDEEDSKNKECTTESEKDKCNKKDGCKFKDGKCKLKEEVKSENDGKTTNTKGSNSFVINKAPLLLAVLIR